MWKHGSSNLPDVSKIATIFLSLVNVGNPFVAKNLKPRLSTTYKYSCLKIFALVYWFIRSDLGQLTLSVKSSCPLYV
jgi:hypothetical protein